MFQTLYLIIQLGLGPINEQSYMFVEDMNPASGNTPHQGRHVDPWSHAASDAPREIASNKFKNKFINHWPLQQAGALK